MIADLVTLLDQCDPPVPAAHLAGSWQFDSVAFFLGMIVRLQGSALPTQPTPDCVSNAGLCALGYFLG
jgi:hypothetical protein